MAGIVACALPVQAQRADAARQDRLGNFVSSRVRGNRGFHQQRYWLVVDPDPSGLNCRDGSRVVARYRYGDVIRIGVKGSQTDAISRIDGRTYLTIEETRDVLHLDRDRGRRPEPFRCVVRANSRYIAPINMDDFLSMEREW